MLVANSFDLWQRDTFFSAAEEVQQSVDIMESAHRAWLRERKEGMRPQFWDDLSRELQMALGTAKWQLEEFEKAVRLSYRRSADEITVIRHKQFVSVMHEQISRVEESLREAFDGDGKQPLRWVNLDDEERDDLALFLTGTLESSQTMNHGAEKVGSTKSGSPQKRTRKHLNGSTEVNAGVQTQKLATFGANNVASYIDDLDVKRSPGARDNVSCQPDIHSGVLEIVIDKRDVPGETLPPKIEATPKEKGFKPGFWRLNREDLPQIKGGMLSFTHWQRIHRLNQFFGRGARSLRQVQNHQMPPNVSIRFILMFMLAIFLVGKLMF
ncbi:OLC1v1035175C1 [Oldenlandia corymbosa var. corymbosa]|uniref:OLC1v1035175C1 n=1 Tax=Oldenlandia corymbosa var. corymbosa TaxID=529605 RepID=A0AAV1CTK3_OLDCO|nr:OLC1v1035175C1 [Oldenlandia corymbosa var. corymbosa]